MKELVDVIGTALGMAEGMALVSLSFGWGWFCIRVSVHLSNAAFHAFLGR